MDLLEKLKAGTENKTTVRFPGSDETVVIHVLSEAQRQDAHFAAERHFKRNDIEVSMATVDSYEGEKTLQMLYRALSDNEGKPLGMTIDAFRNGITVDQKNILVEEYLALEKECSPLLETMSEVEIDNLIDDLKKKPETLGSISNIVTARQLISSLVKRLPNSQPDSGSTLP